MAFFCDDDFVYNLLQNSDEPNEGRIPDSLMDPTNLVSQLFTLTYKTEQ